MGRFATQLCQIPPASSTLLRTGQTSMAPPLMISPLLGSWETCHYDFHWHDGQLPEAMRIHREHQQDAAPRQHWTGLIAGTDSDGGMRWREERMGAGYVVGTDLEPNEELSLRVGCPLSSLSSLRADAAG